MKWTFTLALMLLAAPFGGVAAEDTLAGKRIVERWCQTCHVADDRARSGSDQAPPFAAIAGGLGDAPDRLRAFLNNPHPPMPKLDLSREEIDDIIAYIQSLR